jgi:adenine C2-methylase RlmN of 23S rRNA A2503 and tRNA A37
MINIIPYNLFEMSKYPNKSISEFVENFIKNLELTIKEYNLNKFHILIDFNGIGYVYDSKKFKEWFDDIYDDKVSDFDEVGDPFDDDKNALKADIISDTYFYLIYCDKDIDVKDIDELSDEETIYTHIYFHEDVINFTIFQNNKREIIFENASSLLININNYKRLIFDKILKIIEK